MSIERERVLSLQGSVVSRNGRLVVEMVNNNDRSVTLKAGQMYGTAGPIDVIEGRVISA